MKYLLRIDCNKIDFSNLGCIFYLHHLDGNTNEWVLPRWQLCDPRTFQARCKSRPKISDRVAVLSFLRFQLNRWRYTKFTMICHVWKFCKDSTIAHACHHPWKRSASGVALGRRTLVRPYRLLGRGSVREEPGKGITDVQLVFVLVKSELLR